MTSNYQEPTHDELVKAAKAAEKWGLTQLYANGRFVTKAHPPRAKKGETFALVQSVDGVWSLPPVELRW